MFSVWLPWNVGWISRIGGWKEVARAKRRASGIVLLVMELGLVDMESYDVCGVRIDYGASFDAWRAEIMDNGSQGIHVRVWWEGGG